MEDRCATYCCRCEPLRLSRPRTISVRGLPRRRVGYRGISSLIFDFDTILNRCAPEKWTRSLAYRPSKDLPFNPAAVPQGAPILLDTTVYIDQLKGDLPPPIIDLIATRPVHHGAPAELAAAIGYLDPLDSRTGANLKPIIETLGTRAAANDSCAERRSMDRRLDPRRRSRAHARSCQRRPPQIVERRAAVSDSRRNGCDTDQPET